MGHRMRDWLRNWGQGGSDDSEDHNGEVVLISSSGSSSSSDDGSSEGTDISEYVMVGDSDMSVETDPSEMNFGSAVYTESDHFSSMDIGGEGMEANMPSPFGATGAVYQIDMVAIPTRYEDVEILVPSTEIIEISSDDALTNSWDGESSLQEVPEIPMPHVYVPEYGVHPYIPSESSEEYQEYEYPYVQTGPVEEDMTAAMPVNQYEWEGEQGVEPLAQEGNRNNQEPSEEMLDLYGQPFAIPSPEYHVNQEENQTVQNETSAENFVIPEEAVPYYGRPIVHLDPETTVADLWWDWDRDAQNGGPIDPQMTGGVESEQGMLPVLANLATFFGMQVGGEAVNQVPAINENDDVVEEQVPVEEQIPVEEQVPVKNPNQVETGDHIEVENPMIEENPNQDGEDGNRVEMEHHDDDEEEGLNHEETVAEYEAPKVWEMGSSSGRRPAGKLRYRSQARKRVPVPARASMPCRVCGGHGHYTYACPNERQGRPLRRDQVTCYSCGMRGHYATSCPGTPMPSSSSSSSTNARRPSGRRGGNSG